MTQYTARTTAATPARIPVMAKYFVMRVPNIASWSGGGSAEEFLKRCNGYVTTSTDAIVSFRQAALYRRLQPKEEFGFKKFSEYSPVVAVEISPIKGRVLWQFDHWGSCNGANMALWDRGRYCRYIGRLAHNPYTEFRPNISRLPSGAATANLFRMERRNIDSHPSATKSRWPCGIWQDLQLLPFPVLMLVWNIQADAYVT